MRKLKNYKIISLLSTLMFLGNFKFVFAGVLSLDSIKMAIGTTLIFLASQVLRISGILFNYIMNYTVNFSQLVEETAVVSIGWEILRNLSNMVFIFIILAISIATILGIQSYGAKRLLTKVILVALLINFSLFTTKIIIDAANIFTVNFYNATIKNAGVEPGSVDEWDRGITAIFAGALNLHTIYKADELKGDNKYGGVALETTNILIVSLMGSVLLIITAFVFFAASVLLTVRLITLMFLMILSPLAFLGMILPATSGYSKEWWDNLFKQAFFAPIFMMFIYIVASAISSPAFKTAIGNPAKATGTGFANVASGGGQILILFNFILIIGLMLASLISASKMGASGAGGMMKMGKDLNKWGQGKIKAGAGAATFGVGGRLSRATIGRGFNKMAESNWMQNRAAQGGAGSRLALKTLRGVGDSSFDVRNTAVGKKMGMGEGIKGGYITHTNEIATKKIKFGQSLKGNTIDNFGNTISRTEAYGQNLNKRTIMSSVIGTTVANRKAGEKLENEFRFKTELEEAQRILRRAKDALKDAEKIGTPLADFRQDVYSAEDTVNELKEKIKKLNEN